MANTPAPAGEEWRHWDGMSPELLALIFTRIPADELVRTVPFVCRGWREAVAGPYCWSEIDIEDWCRRVDRSELIDVAVRRLVRRSGGTLRRLSAHRIGISGFAFTAFFGNHLKVLEIPMSEVTDLILQKYAGFLTELEELDISYCNKITSKGIEILGKHCKSLVKLTRNMTPPEFVSTMDNGVAPKINEEEALAVGNTMLKLEKLELASGCFSDHGLSVILTNCKALRSLDIRGCWNVELAGNVGPSCLAMETFKDPYSDTYDLFPFSSEENAESDDASAVEHESL